MAQVGYCSGCGRYVELREDRSCVEGHPVSMIRDVRDSVPSTVARAGAGTRASASTSAGAVAGAGEAGKKTAGAVDAMVKVSWVLTVVGIVGVLVLGTWLSLPQFTAMGMSTPMAWLASAGSVAATLGGAVVWARMRKRRR